MPETANQDARSDREMIAETLDRTRRLNSAARILVIMGGLCVAGIAVCVVIALQVLWKVIQLTTALGAS